MKYSICDYDFDSELASHIVVFLNGEIVPFPVAYDCGKGEVWCFEVDGFGERVIDKRTGFTCFEKKSGFVTAMIIEQ